MSMYDYNCAISENVFADKAIKFNFVLRQYFFIVLCSYTLYCIFYRVNWYIGQTVADVVFVAATLRVLYLAATIIYSETKKGLFVIPSFSIEKVNRQYLYAYALKTPIATIGKVVVLMLAICALIINFKI